MHIGANVQDPRLQPKLQLLHLNATRGNSLFLAEGRLLRIIKDKREGAIRVRVYYFIIIEHNVFNASRTDDVQ